MGWERYIGPNGLSIGLDRFGASAPGKDLAEELAYSQKFQKNHQPSKNYYS